MSNHYEKLPSDFKPLLWSYDFDKIDTDKDKKPIIVNTINYGDLDQWRWIKACYGEDTIKSILMEIPHTELRDRVRPLVSLIFSISSFNYAPRNANRGS